MTNDVDTLATALYVKTDDLLKQYPDLAPWRPQSGLQPQLADAELVTLAVMQALLGYTSESRWVRHARAHLGHLFGYLAGQPGYNRRLRAAAGLITTLIRMLAADTSLWTDDVWVAAPPVECGWSRETARRSDLAGWAEYGYCASHSRYFWGLRLHLLAPCRAAHRLRPGRAKAGERQVLLDILADPALTAGRDSQIIIADKNYYGRSFETVLAEGRICLLRPARQGEPGLGEYVGAAKQVAEKLRLGAAGTSPLGYALVLAAADWRRSGMTRPIPTAMLTDLAKPHLDRRGQAQLADPDTFNAGLAWATRDINPNVSLLHLSLVFSLVP